MASTVTLFHRTGKGGLGSAGPGEAGPAQHRQGGGAAQMGAQRGPVGLAQRKGPLNPTCSGDTGPARWNMGNVCVQGLTTGRRTRGPAHVDTRGRNSLRGQDTVSQGRGARPKAAE